MSDGQIIGIASAVAGLVGTIAAAVVNRYGATLQRDSTKDTRQTAIEQGLQSQLTESNKRIDAFIIAKNESDCRFRAELEAGEAARRNIEREFRAAIVILEKEIDELRKDNSELAHENWLLKHAAVGSAEGQVIERIKTDGIERTGEV
jgi:hypothetical protein